MSFLKRFRDKLTEKSADIPRSDLVYKSDLIPRLTKAALEPIPAGLTDDMDDLNDKHLHGLRNAKSKLIQLLVNEEYNQFVLFQIAIVPKI